jgi:hypothetical protein
LGKTFQQSDIGTDHHFLQTFGSLRVKKKKLNISKVQVQLFVTYAMVAPNDNKWKQDMNLPIFNVPNND